MILWCKNTTPEKYKWNKTYPKFVWLKFCQLVLHSETNTLLSNVHYFVAVTCTTLGLLANGEIQYSNGEEYPGRGYPIGTNATILCDHGYSLIGPSSKTCQTTRNWTHGIPTCTQSKWHIMTYLSITYFFYCTTIFCH